MPYGIFYHQLSFPDFRYIVWGLATAACGLASSIAALVVFRFVLGAVEAPSYPASSTTVTR